MAFYVEGQEEANIETPDTDFSRFFYNKTTKYWGYRKDDGSVFYFIPNEPLEAALTAHIGDTNNPHAVTKAQVGLGNADNTSDVNKPISTATQNALDLKYNASNPNGYETPAQLNTRDTNNRARANHTGTQLASTISDFAAAVRAVVLTGISFATATAVVAADSVLVAIGKLQAQLNTILNPPTTEASVATTTTTTSATDVLMNSMTITPPAGTYLAMFSSTLESSNNSSTIFASIYAGGVKNNNSERFTQPRVNAFLDIPNVLSTQAEVTVNGAQAIEVRWRRTAGTATANARSLNLTRIR